MLEFKGLEKSFGKTKVITGIGLKVEQGEFFCLLGPSGCGKTTLLRLAAGLEKPDEGVILLDGKDVTHLPPDRRGCAMVFQNYALWPHMTVAENIAYGLESRGMLAKLLEGLAMLPLVLPGILVAISYVGFFSGGPLDPARNPLPLLVMAYGMRRLSITFKSIQTGWDAIPVGLDEAARLFGASPLRRVLTVQLPLLSAQVIGSGLLVFAFSVLEVSDSLVLASQERFFPLTKGIYFLAGRAGDGQNLAAALSLVGVGVLLFAMLGAGRIMGNRFGDGFKT